VGIVSPSERHAASLMALLGLEEAARGFVAAYRALCVFTRPAGGSPLEFVIPEGGALKEFNRGAGGLHHIAIEVADLRDTARELKERGMELLEPEPVQGAGDFECNFLSPVYTRGVIIEFVQTSAP
jgi:methylmalonyl-CoA/ethylmalonyl-CoA epimerase